MSIQAANAQLTTAQQNAAKSLASTGYTNHYPLNPPKAWCSGCKKVTVPYSINLGQIITMTQDQPRTSLDIILAPTQHHSAPGLLTIQIHNICWIQRIRMVLTKLYQLRRVAMVFFGDKSKH